MRKQLFLLTAAAALLAMAQPQARRGPSPRANEPEKRALSPEDYCRVEGSVMHAQTGEPMRKADVQLLSSGQQGPGSGEGGQSAATGEDGRFAFRDVAPGRYTLRVSKTGFIRQGGSRSNANAAQLSSLSLVRGQKVSDLSIKMLPQGVIMGRVLDADGDPVARVNVSAYRYAYTSGRKALTSFGGVSTNDLGEYRIWGLAPGTYYVGAVPMDMFGAGPRLKQASESFVPTFFPSSDNAERANPVEITVGLQAANQDIRLRKARLYTVAGTVVDGATGQAASRLSVHLGSNGSQGDIMLGGRGSNAVTREGTFSISGVLPGSYTLEAQVHGNNSGPSAVGSLKLEVGNENLTGLQVVVQPLATIAGAVKFEGSEAPAKPYVRVMLEPINQSWMGGMAGGSTAEDGKFAVINVGAQKYRLRLVGIPQGFYLKDAKLGNQDIRTTGLDFTAGTAVSGELELTLSANPGALEGTVKSGSGKDEPQANATVVLIPKDDWAGIADRVRTTTSGAQGDFRFADLAPGEYEVYAFEDIEPGAWNDPDVRRQYRDAARSVKVEKGSTANAELKSARQ